MATTLSNGTDTVLPDLVLGYASSRRSRNVEHDILDRSDPDYSLHEAGTRTGTLELLFASETDALAAEQLHAAPATWTLVDLDRPSLAMTYVLAGGGELVRELEGGTRKVWIVRIPYREVIT